MSDNEVKFIIHCLCIDHDILDGAYILHGYPIRLFSLGDSRMYLFNDGHKIKIC